MNRLIYYTLAFCGLFCSCDDFLDESPKHSMTVDNAVTNYKGAQNVVNGAYSIIEHDGNFGGKLAGYWSSQAGIWDNEIVNYEMSYREGNNDFSSMWCSWYKLINAANTACQGVSSLDTAYYPSVEEKNRLLADVRCLRGWAYSRIFYMFSHWWEDDSCPYGLLYRDQMANLVNLQVPRLNVGDSYAKIFEDLDFAIAYLDDFHSSRHCSKQLAQVTKAQLLLNRGVMRKSSADLEEALKLVQDVRRTAPTSWRMAKDLGAMYEKGWDGEEVLWARYLGDYDVMMKNYETTYSYTLGNNSVFYDIFEKWLQEDPRYDIIMNDVKAPDAWNDNTVLALTKLYHQGILGSPQAPFATYYFRYPELYLMESELMARLDGYSVEEALKPLNEMRSSRTVPVLPPLAASSKSELLRILFQEICLETFLENGSEYLASLRFINDTDKSAFEDEPWIYTLKSEVSFSSDQYCWPIPIDELNKNKLAEQNPGLKE